MKILAARVPLRRGSGYGEWKPIMTAKLLFIVALAAAFGWGFSSLVKHSELAIGPEGQRVACEQWAGNECANRFVR